MVFKSEGEAGEGNYGEDPWKREINRHLMNGVINLDKPSGPSSHEVAAWVKRMLGLKKVGHGGTLEVLKPGKSSRFRSLALSPAERD